MNPSTYMSSVERDHRVAKYWLDPIRLHSSGGFGRVELKRIRDIIEENQVRPQNLWVPTAGT